jgi:hypothetical protein
VEHLRRLVEFPNPSINYIGSCRLSERSVKLPGEIDRLSRRLAKNPLGSDYDFWRALRDLNDEIYALGKCGHPVPINLLRLRAILREARETQLRGDA